MTMEQADRRSGIATEKLQKYEENGWYALLEEIHERERTLQSLDYLIRQAQKEQREQKG